jgi:hypothetical protein
MCKTFLCQKFYIQSKVVVCPLGFQTPLCLQRFTFRYFISLFLLCFVITFFISIDITIAPPTSRPPYNDLEWRMQVNTLLLIISSIFSYPWLTLAFCIIALCFLGRSNEIAADIGSLEPELDGHGLGIGIGLNGLRNTWRTLQFFFRCTDFSIVDCLTIVLSKNTIF